MKNKLLITGIILVFAVLIMRYFDAPLKNEICTKGIVSFELAKELSNSKAIINSWNENAQSNALKSLLFDFVFILIYVSFIVQLVKKTKFKIKKIIIYGVFLAGFFDFIENIALLNLLHHNFAQYLSSIAFYAASTKFLLLGVSLVYLFFSGIMYLIVKKTEK